jgi:hypothetical protein
VLWAPLEANQAKRSVKQHRRRSNEANNSPWRRHTERDVDITNVIAATNSANSDVTGCLSQTQATGFWANPKITHRCKEKNPKDATQENEQNSP